MSEIRKTLGGAAVALLAIVCCAALPLLIGAGVGAAALAAVGGLTLGLVALAVVALLVLIGVRARRRSGARPAAEKPRAGAREHGW